MINQIIFPVGINADWHTPDRSRVPDPYLKNWLLDTGSLTERLQSHCRQFDLVVVGQDSVPVTCSEYDALEVKQDSRRDEMWQVREVVLYGEGVPWVFARSVLPLEMCHSDLKNLGNNPLGQKLFNDVRFERKPFEVCELKPAEGLLTSLDLPQHPALWGRRSVFSFKQMRMLVAEIFLPDSPAYTHSPQLLARDC